MHCAIWNVGCTFPTFSEKVSLVFDLPSGSDGQFCGGVEVDRD